MKKILITGSTGLLGLKLTPYLKKRFQVVEMRNRLNDIEGMRPYFKDAEFVLHLAALKEDGPSCDEFYKVNVEGTANIAKLCLEYGVKMIHFSTTAITHQDFYGITKLMAEKEVEKYIAYRYEIFRPGLQAVTLRFPSIYTGNKRLTLYYSIHRLLKDTERIILKHDFSKYKIYELRSKFHWLLYLKKKIRFKRGIIGQLEDEHMKSHPIK